MIVRRCLAVLAAGFLCGFVLAAAGCDSSGAVAGTTNTDSGINTGSSSPTETTITSESVQLHPVRVEGKWGFIDNTGAVKIEPQFAGVRRVDGAGGIIGFCEGYAPVQLVEDGPWGYIDTSGHLVIEPQFDLAQWFSEGLAVVRNGGDWYFVDGTGATVLGPYDGAIGFSGDLAWVDDGAGGPWPIDKNGDRVPEVEGPGGSRLAVSSGYSEDLAVAYTIEEVEGVPAGLGGYVDASGALVIEPRFNVTGDFSEGLAAVGIGQNDEVMRYGYIDKTGAWAIQPQFWMANPFAEGLARVAIKGKDSVKVGYIDRTGAWVIEPELDDGLDFSEGLALVWQNGECGYIDKSGTVVIPIPYVIEGWSFSGGVARLGGGFYGSPSYIDKTGKIIWQGSSGTG